MNYAARADAAEAVVNGIKGAGGRAIAVAADGDAVTSMIERVTAELGPVTLLIKRPLRSATLNPMTTNNSSGRAGSTSRASLTPRAP